MTTLKNPVDLKDLADTLTCVSDDVYAYLDTQTGEFIMITEAEMSRTDEDINEDDLDEEEKEIRAQLQNILDDIEGRYLQLPTRFDIPEAQLMEDFTKSVRDHAAFEDLRSAINGGGAFKIFRTCLEKHKLEQDWYEFRDKALREIGKEWCEANELEYKD